MKRLHLLSALTCWICPTVLLATSPAAAGDASRVVAVKLYPGSATVARVLQVPAGARQAIFACLPAGLDIASLHVDASEGLRVGHLSALQQPRELLGSTCANPLDERIRTLQDQAAELDAESQGIGYAMAYLKSFGASAPSAGQELPPRSAGAAQIAPTVQALQQSAQAALKRQHQIKRQQEALEDALKPLLAERQRTGGKSAHVTTVQVMLAAPQGGQLRLSYQVRGPGWQPAYRATLDSAKQQVRLQRQALVAQSTGEDWNGVQLTLSTGQPGAPTQGPLPRPWRVGIAAQPEARMPMQKQARAQATSSLATPANEVDDSALPNFGISQTDTTFAAEFAVPQKITVPSSGQRVSLTLGEYSAATSLLTRTAPAEDASAYLIATLAAPPGIWPDGPLALYRDGAFIGNGRFSSSDLAQNGLAFGRDELVSVHVQAPERNAGSSGFITSRNEERIQHAYTVHNRHTQPITLQVLDAAPVAEHEDVHVDASYAPGPTSTEWLQQKGLVMWQQTLPPGEQQQFRAQHIITWPQNASLRQHP